MTTMRFSDAIRTFHKTRLSPGNVYESLICYHIVCLSEKRESERERGGKSVRVKTASAANRKNVPCSPLYVRMSTFCSRISVSFAFAGTLLLV